MNNETYKNVTYRIHPAIGIARLGNSPDEFCISPEKPATLPTACDNQGNPLMSDDGTSEVSIKEFKDSKGRIKRQAARFQIYLYDEDNPEGRPLQIGDKVKGGGNHGTLIDIQWQVYLANKKSSWYEFQGNNGEHGYSADHRRRNADITDEQARQMLIIDPGPQVVNATDRRQARFDKENTEFYAPNFPPSLTPNSIETLGEIKTDNTGKLLVLGGHGNSGTFKSEIGQPRIDSYANTDGWFDDTSDGVVMARLVMYSEEVEAVRYVDVEYPAWVVVGYPRYVPQILGMVTAQDVFEDLAIREFAYRTDIYGEIGTFKNPQIINPNDTGALMHWKRGRLGWNPDYKPWFYRDVWTILFRADEMSYLTNILSQSNFPHNQSKRGNFDPEKLSVPPILNKTAFAKRCKRLIAEHQSGELFLETMEPTLSILDERLKNRLDGNLGIGLVEALNQDKIRENLQKAIARFASEINSLAKKLFDNEGLTDNPKEYLKRWQGVYNHVQEASSKDAIKNAYLKAKETLDDEIQKIIEQLFENVQKSSEISGKKMLLSLAPRVSAAEKVKKDAPLSIEDSFDLHLKEFRTGKLLANYFVEAEEKSTHDPFRVYRQYLYDLLRQEGEENQLGAGGNPNSRTYNLPLMPLLAGDNPVSNISPSKFLRLTNYQIYILRQWAEGKFYNEKSEGWVKDVEPFEPYKNWTNKTGRDLDCGVLSNLLGGAFFPGAEIGWIMRNPSIFKEPYRLKADPDFYNFSLTAAQANTRGISPNNYIAYATNVLSQDSDFKVGLQPGDLTKQMALPWQADFNECTTQMIDVTYENWNVINPDSENDTWAKLEQQVWDTLWWPSHRPLQVLEVVGLTADKSPIYQNLEWARGIPQSLAGDLKMVTAWSKLGFVVRNPYLTEEQLNTPSPDNKYISVERFQEKKK